MGVDASTRHLLPAQRPNKIQRRWRGRHCICPWSYDANHPAYDRSLHSQCSSGQGRPRDRGYIAFGFVSLVVVGLWVYGLVLVGGSAMWHMENPHCGVFRDRENAG